MNLENFRLPTKQIPAELGFWVILCKPIDSAIFFTFDFFKVPTGKSMLLNKEDSICDRKNVWSLSTSKALSNLNSLMKFFI